MCASVPQFVALGSTQARKNQVPTHGIAQLYKEHAQCDLNFGNMKNNPNSIFDEGIERYNDTQEKYYNNNGSRSQK